MPDEFTIEFESVELRRAIASGNRRVQLEALRDLLAHKLDTGICRHCGGPKGEAAGLGALSRQLLNVLDAIESLPPATEESPRDQLAAKRARRLGRADSANNIDSAATRNGERRPGSSGAY